VAQIPGSSPRLQPQVRSVLKLPRNFDWDSSVKYVSALPAENVHGYLRLDSRLAWRLGESLELSVIGQNLSSGRHFEFIDFTGIYLKTEVSRSVSAKLAWRF
jgi:iron complex outermembrane receptor protein